MQIKHLNEGKSCNAYLPNTQQVLAGIELEIQDLNQIHQTSPGLRAIKVCLLITLFQAHSSTLILVTAALVTLFDHDVLAAR